jgi:hypothetical protein
MPPAIRILPDGYFGIVSKRGDGELDRMVE